MNSSITSLPWNEAELLEMTIDRRHPGRRDEVQFRMKWADGSKSTVVFGECYAMLAQMNFGVTCTEKIVSVEQLADEPGLAQIRAHRSAAGESMDDVSCFRIKTAPTGDVIRIYAREFKVL